MEEAKAAHRRNQRTHIAVVQQGREGGLADHGTRIGVQTLLAKVGKCHIWQHQKVQ